MTDNTISFYIIDPHKNEQERADVAKLLAQCDLDFENTVEIFVVGRQNGQLAACAGLDGNIVKCVATSPDWRGESLSLRLMGEMAHVAYELGRHHLFLFTRPYNVEAFQGCGFYLLAEVSDQCALMENTPFGIRNYCQSLARLRKDGQKIGGIVVNANPFTYGHQYLIRTAASQCDWLHLFVVAEDASFISYRDRFALVQEGVKGIPNLTLHPGSQYMVSRATFPDYFFKDKGMVGECCTAIDLLLFRNYIAPALGVTHRFVGTEPFCPTTRKYNDDMKQWLQTEPTRGSPITVVEIPRTAVDGTPVSASQVRRLLADRDLEALTKLVPESTLALLKNKYMPAA
ncbi:[citrate (pro-3S)-lyase] ligase [Formivibrio citricus]|uniref:[Citrate [pro-3S]-lyase] ligase n=1 Tax=Formivibrio citricus TaxID=83765 RepID=A0A1I5DSN0_9NEIS|nr:[citrate (pro-3S)-lyase] ligase [Formivibrio citricus]SFO02186.1 [citrate (pro-3S)-lyase] ligase [Formivibrio citricus]